MYFSFVFFHYGVTFLVAFPMVGWDRFESLRRLLRFADREVVLVFKMLAELLF